MNKEYTYIDGKVIIRNENGNQQPIEYYDNIEKVLEQENVVEKIENRINTLEKTIKERKNKKFNPSTVVFTIVATIIGSLVFLGITPALGYNLVEALYGVFICSCIIIPIGTAMTISDYIDFKKKKRETLGAEYALDFLVKQLPKEKQILEELKADKSKKMKKKNLK